MKTLLAIVSMGLLSAMTRQVVAQVSMDPPKHYLMNSGTIISPGGLLHPEFVINNNYETNIFNELLDQNTITLICRAARIKEEQMKDFVIAPEFRDLKYLCLFRLTQEGTNTIRQIAPFLLWYVACRKEGHSTKYMHEALTNRLETTQTQDPDVRLLATNLLLVPSNAIEKVASGLVTNKAGTVERSFGFGVFNPAWTSATQVDRNNQSVERMRTQNEVCRWVRLRIEDEGIDWYYVLDFSTNGELNDIEMIKSDAKERDSHIKEIMAKVDSDIKKEMGVGSDGQVRGRAKGSWLRKKKKLHELGIEWRTPAELNYPIIFE